MRRVVERVMDEYGFETPAQMAFSALAAMGGGLGFWGLAVLLWAVLAA